MCARPAACRATPRGSRRAPASLLRASGSGCRRWLGQRSCSWRAPSRSPCPAKRTLGHRLPCPPRHCSHASQGMAGSTATRWPANRPSRTTPANSCPGTSGSEISVSPMPPSANQCRSEPQMPTEVTASRDQPSGAGPGGCSSLVRRSPLPCRRATRDMSRPPRLDPTRTRPILARRDHAGAGGSKGPPAVIWRKPRAALDLCAVDLGERAENLSVESDPSGRGGAAQTGPG